MDTIGKLTHLKSIIQYAQQTGSDKNMLELIASDPIFMVSGLRKQRDLTGTIRPCFMKSWDKNALKLFLGIRLNELDMILCAEDSQQAIRRIEDIIQQYRSQTKEHELMSG